MKNLLIILLAAVSLSAGAQLQTPNASPAGSVSTVVGLTDVKVSYSRPRMKGRKIFGTGAEYLVQFGKIWRTGANSGTRISFSDDVKVEGIAVPKGEYLIFSWPGATEWTVSLYADLSLGGNTDGYDKTKETARFVVKPEKLTERVEVLTINVGDISDNSTEAKVQLAWENTSVKFRVTVDYDTKVMKSIDEATKVSPGVYGQAAAYYFENGKDLKKALEWMTIACDANPGAYWNLLTKAKIQKAIGDKAGAAATSALSRAAAEKAKNFEYVKMNDDFVKSLK
ncbi:MAG: DUF2911 domain-containing protein [Bacteroidota bacterium]